MTIAICGNPFPEHFTKYIQHLVKKLENEHVKIIIEDEFNTFLKKISVLQLKLTPSIAINH